MDILKNAKVGKDTDKVVKLNDLEHARKRAAMYMGGLESIDCHLYRVIAFDDGTYVLKHDKELFSPAAAKLIEEILSNAIDQFSKTRKANIKLTFDRKTGEIIVMNNYSCVPLTMSTDEFGNEIPTPELCFGHFKSSSNFSNTNVMSGS